DALRRLPEALRSARTSAREAVAPDLPVSGLEAVGETLGWRGRRVQPRRMGPYRRALIAVLAEVVGLAMLQAGAQTLFRVVLDVLQRRGHQMAYRGQGHLGLGPIGRGHLVIVPSHQEAQRHGGLLCEHNAIR